MIYNIKRKLKIIRNKNCFSQKDVAARLGITVLAYAKMETGVSDLTIKKLQNIMMYIIFL